ncbi:MAG TPA: NTP transferase domain-containing protein [Jiangellales bacterium]|nr:NTP transferase domain-containing protein [Jiangellales bacterium]
MAKAAGVVLAGGRSSRMGTPKAALEWHGSTLLRRVTGVVARGVDGPVVVVAARDQVLPDVDPHVEVVRDALDGRGPLQGLAAGLAALADRADVAFVCSTDLPFLHVAFVRAVVRPLLDDAAGKDVVLPVVHGYRQPLVAAYRTTLLVAVERLLAADRLRPAHLLDECGVLQLDQSALLADRALAAADPGLDSVVNVNDPDGYAAARARPAPAVTVECFGVLAGAAGRGTRRVAAATLGEAARARGLALGPHVVAAVNGDQIARDPDLPLVSGDAVAFLSADAGG